MTVALCLLLTLWVQNPSTSDDPAAWVARLGSMKYAEREAAAEALERLGRSALPALQLARDSNDLETRTRSLGLIQKIEGSLLTQPTMLRLGFKEAPLSDVVRNLSQQSGIKVSLVPESDPRMKAQTVTLQVGEPVPFWKGIDLICQASRLHPNLGMVMGNPGQEPTLALMAGIGQPILPTCDHGPFRVHLSRLHSERDISYGAVPPGVPHPLGGRQTLVDSTTSQLKPIVHVQCHFQLQISAEPRLWIAQSGRVKMLEALDDRGNSLLGASAGGMLENPPTLSRFPRQFVGAGEGQQLQATVPLNRPESPGQVLKVLKGTIPVRVASRRPDPLVVPLANSAGKSFENREIAIIVNGISQNPPKSQTMIEVTVRSKSAETISDLRAEPNTTPDASQPAPDSPQQKIEVLDAQGRTIPWFQTSMVPDSSHLTITLNHFGRARVEPKEIRFYSLIRAITEIPFEFRDLPMP